MKLPALFLCLAAFTCKPKVTVQNGDEVKGAGITFLVPVEDSGTTTGPDVIEYNGKSVKAKSDGKSLTVDGTDFGPVSKGDTIDLRTKGKVAVNGVAREPAKKAE